MHMKKKKMPTVGQWWIRALPGGLVVNNLSALRRPGFDPWDRKILRRRTSQPMLVFRLEKSHGLRNLVGYNQWWWIRG